MRTLSLLAISTYILAGAALGTRLLLMWRRTRKLPELMFGFGFLFAVFATSLFVLRVSFPRAIPREWTLPLVLIGSFCTALTAVARLIATWRIFQPDRKWAMGLVVVASAALLGQYVASLPTGAFNRWQPAVDIVPFAWMAVEAFRYHARLRRRLRLGLADPVVMNRIWLWGWSGALLAFLNVLYFLTVYVPAMRSIDVLLSYMAVPLLANAFCSWLAFYPPAAYLRMVQRRHAPRAA